MKSLVIGILLSCSFAIANPGVLESGHITDSDPGNQLSLIEYRESVEVFARRGFFFDWGEAQNGWGYCYKWANNGRVLNEGRPVPNRRCERRNPSIPDWGTGQNGWGYCYRYTPYGIAMNEGRPIADHFCERRDPSFYNWGTGQNGYTYCYQYTGKGVAMNEGRPVDDYYCQ